MQEQSIEKQLIRIHTLKVQSSNEKHLKKRRPTMGLVGLLNVLFIVFNKASDFFFRPTR
jgi:hypothetical protein